MPTIVVLSTLAAVCVCVCVCVYVRACVRDSVLLCARGRWFKHEPTSACLRERVGVCLLACLSSQGLV